MACPRGEQTAPPTAELMGPAAPLVEAFTTHMKAASTQRPSDEAGGAGSPTKKPGIVSWSSTLDQAFRRLTSDKPFLEGISAHYFEECMVHERAEINKELARSPFAEMATRTMLAFHGARFSEEDRKRCVTKNPGPDYFMLCEDEELGTGDDGQMDGDLRIRQSCSSWKLTILGTLGATFVEYTGETWGGETVGIGMLYSFAPDRASSTANHRLAESSDYRPAETSEEAEASTIYTFVDGECTPAEGQKDKAVILSSLAEAFERSLEAPTDPASFT